MDFDGIKGHFDLEDHFRFTNDQVDLLDGFTELINSDKRLSDFFKQFNFDITDYHKLKRYHFNFEIIAKNMIIIIGSLTELKILELKQTLMIIRLQFLNSEIRSNQIKYASKFMEILWNKESDETDKFEMAFILEKYNCNNDNNGVVINNLALSNNFNNVLKMFMEIAKSECLSFSCAFCQMDLKINCHDYLKHIHNDCITSSLILEIYSSIIGFSKNDRYNLCDFYKDFFQVDIPSQIQNDKEFVSFGIYNFVHILFIWSNMFSKNSNIDYKYIENTFKAFEYVFGNFFMLFVRIASYYSILNIPIYHTGNLILNKFIFSDNIINYLN